MTSVRNINITQCHPGKCQCDLRATLESGNDVGGSHDWRRECIKQDIRGSTEWQVGLTSCRKQSSYPGQAKLVDVDNVMIAVFNLDGEYHAYEDVCTHDGSHARLWSRARTGHRWCRNHLPASRRTFLCKTGNALDTPAYEPTTHFPVRVKTE